MSEPVRRLITALLILGRPGSGKTSLLATFAEYLWETHHKVLCLYSWDGGAIPTRVQVRVRQGLIRFCRALTRSADGLGIDTLYHFTRGYWPRQINAETGEMTPAAELVAPITTDYALSCPKGHPLGTFHARSLIQSNTLCPECKLMYPETELLIAETVRRTRGFELVGGVAYDGLTSMTSTVIDFMDRERGFGRIGGEKSAFGGTVQSGTTKYGGTNRADIGFGQTRGREFVSNTRSIPYLVADPVFTALSNEGSDEGGLSIVGAKLPGQAATAEASAWFGNVTETGKFVDEAGKEHFALYLRPFIDAQNRHHLLKTSASPTGIPDVYVDPIGEPWKESNLGRLFKALDADLQAGLSEPLDGAPGLAPIDYGDAAPAAHALPAGNAVPAGGEDLRRPTAPSPVAPTAPLTSTLKRRGPRSVVPAPATAATQSVAPPVSAASPIPVTPAEPTPTPPTQAASAAPPPGAKPPVRVPTAATAKKESA